MVLASLNATVFEDYDFLSWQDAVSWGSRSPGDVSPYWRYSDIFQ